MTELSIPWPETSGPVIGDGREYTDAEWRQVWRVLFQGADAVNEVVVPSAGDLAGQLVVTSPGANQILVGTGSALVDGIYYINDAAKALAPASAGPGLTRKDRVVIRASWGVGTEQYTARLYIKEGDSTNPPALTQTRNATWEVSLATYTINDVGVISSLVDERKFLHVPTKVRQAMVEANAIGDAQLRQSAALSVVGRSANSAGNVADIPAGANNQLLARVGNTLQWVQITIGMIPDFLITEAKLANGAVTAGKLADGAVDTPARLAGGVVTGATIASGAVTEAKIAPSAVTHVKIANGAVYEVTLAAEVKGKLVTNGNTHNHTGGAGALIPTAGIANDAVDDTKVGNRVPQFYRRQGGDPSNWAMPGIANYTPGAVRMQAGVMNVTIPQDSEAGGVVVTFPQAFSAPPIVLVSLRSEVPGYGVSHNNPISTSVAIVVHRSSSSGPAATLTVHWLAIGPE